MRRVNPLSVAKAEFLIKQYGLDRPVWEQYLVWMGFMPGQNGFSGLLQGDWGWSFEYDRPVMEVIGDALWLTLLVNFAVVIFIHLVSIPDRDLFRHAAIFDWRLCRDLHRLYRACHAELPAGADHALLRQSLVRRFHRRALRFAICRGAMDWPKIQSLLSHLIVPTLVIGLGGTAAMIRRMRANLLDELGKQYYVTAKAKGLTARKALLKYPFRMSLNPFISDIGNLLPHLVSGSVLVSLVLSLPTVGPILLNALKSQDQFLAGFILMFVAILTVIGMLVSDLLLAWLDPRIRIGGGA